MLAGIRDRNGNSTTLSYAEDILVEATDSSGRKIEFRNNEFGFITEVLVPHPSAKKGKRQLPIVRYEYDNEPHLVAVKDALQNTSFYKYDSNHLITQATDRTGVSFFWEYDVSGLWPRCSKTWGDQDVLYGEFSYDRPHRTTTITDKDGHTWTTEYDSRGLVQATVDALGQRWQRSHDALGNLLAAHSPKVVYDKRGLVTEATATSGRCGFWEWDDAGNLSSTQSPNGEHSQYEYDALGRIVQETDSDGTVTRHVLDDAGRRISTESCGSTWNFEYDAEGNQIREDAGDSIYQHSANGRLQAASYSDQRVEYSPQDRVGNMQGLPRGLSATEETVTEMKGWTVSWDSNGNIIRKCNDTTIRLLLRWRWAACFSSRVR